VSKWPCVGLEVFGPTPCYYTIMACAQRVRRMASEQLAEEVMVMSLSETIASDENNHVC
jgi:hypothetical protein